MQRLIKAVNLLTITSLKLIKDMVDKVMHCNNGPITEPGQDNSERMTLPAKT